MRIASLPRRLVALAGLAFALLVLTASPAAAHPGHGAEAGHDHTLSLGGWVLVAVVLSVTVVGLLLLARARTRRLQPVGP